MDGGRFAAVCATRDAPFRTGPIDVWERLAGVPSSRVMERSLGGIHPGDWPTDYRNSGEAFGRYGKAVL